MSTTGIPTFDDDIRSTLGLMKTMPIVSETNLVRLNLVFTV